MAWFMILITAIKMLIKCIFFLLLEIMISKVLTNENLKHLFYKWKKRRNMVFKNEYIYIYNMCVCVCVLLSVCVCVHVNKEKERKVHVNRMKNSMLWLLFYRWTTVFRQNKWFPVSHQLLTTIVYLEFILSIIIRTSEFDHFSNLGILYKHIRHCRPSPDHTLTLNRSNVIFDSSISFTTWDIFAKSSFWISPFSIR